MSSGCPLCQDKEKKLFGLALGSGSASETPIQEIPNVFRSGASLRAATWQIDRRMDGATRRVAGIKGYSAEPTEVWLPVVLSDDSASSYIKINLHDLRPAE